jgi:integrase
LRHSHIIHYVHLHKLPLAVVQKQVGHTSLKTTSVYLNPSDEAVAEAYRSAPKYPTQAPQFLNSNSVLSFQNGNRK